MWLAIAAAVPLGLVIVATVASTVILSMVGWQPFSMPSSSMRPAFFVVDYFFVDKRAYGEGRMPQRGDIVAHYLPDGHPGRLDQNGRRVEYIKRIVGMPGETILMVKGVPVINGVPLTHRAGAMEQVVPHVRHRARRVREELPGGRAYDLFYYSSDSRNRNAGPFVVPAGRYFMLGDNRDDSLDSRDDLSGFTRGPKGWYVPLADIIGRANYVYWSGLDWLDRIGHALQ